MYIEVAKAGRPSAPQSRAAAEMQAEAKRLVAENGLRQSDLVKATGRSASAVGAALNSQPPRETPTLGDIFNYLTQGKKSKAIARNLSSERIAQQPLTARQLASALRELADLLAPQQRGD